MRGYARTLARGIAAVVIGFIGSGTAHAQTNNYFTGVGGSSLSGTNWGTNPGGPFTSAFDATNGGIINFGQANSGVAGASITTAGINATANVTFATIGGTISNFNNAVVPIDVAGGVALDFSIQGFTSSATAGYTKTGAGTVALAGGTYAGGFTLNAGTVVVRGANALGAGGALRVNGGTLAADADRDLSGKYAGGILVVGDFTLGAAAGLASAAANLTFGDAVDLLGATRTIALGGTGTYALNGSVSNGSLAVAGTGGAGNLVLGGTNAFAGPVGVNNALLTYAAATALPAGVTHDLSNGATLGFAAGFAPTQAFLAARVAPGGTGGVAIGNDSAQSFDFSAAGLNLTNGSLGAAAGTSVTYTGTLTPNNPNVVQLGGGGGTLTYAPAVAGAGVSLVAGRNAGGGTVVLPAANTYGGGTTLAGGSLRIENTGALGSAALTVEAGAVTSAAGTAGTPFLDVTQAGAQTLATDIVLPNDTVANTYRGLRMAGASGNVVTLTGLISGGGAGTVLQFNNTAATTPSSVFQLTNVSNSFTGRVEIARGTLQIAGPAALGNAANGVAFNGASGTLQFGTTAGSGETITFDRAVSLATAGTLDTNGYAVVASQPIAGAAGLTKAGTGTLVLTAANSYTTTAVTAGTLQLGNAGTTGTLGSGAVTLGSGTTLRFNWTTPPGAVANAIGGAGGVTKDGANTVILTGANAYAGPTAVNAGTLQIGDGGATGALGTGTATLAAGTTLAFNRTGTLAVSAPLSGGGAVVKNAAGTVSLTGASPLFTGGITVTAGTLEAAGTAANVLGTGAVQLADGATLQINRADAAGTPFVLANAINNLPNGTTGGLTKVGTGAARLTAANGFSGPTNVTAGSLQIGNANALQFSPTVTVAAGASLDYTAFGSGSLPAGQTVRGNGSLLPGDGNTLVVPGGTTLAGGTGGVGTAAVLAVGAGRLSLSPGSRLLVTASAVGGATNTAPTGASLVQSTGKLELSGTDRVNVVVASVAGADALPGFGGGPFRRRVMTYADDSDSFLSNALFNGRGGVLSGTEVAYANTDSQTAFNVLPGAGLAVVRNDWTVFVGGTTGAYYVDVQFTPTPEPGTALAVAAAGLGLARFARRRKTAG